jgi:OOP family OmpA-OmpF porin
MNMTRLLSLAAVVAALATPVATQAQEGTTFYLTPQVGWQVFDADRDLEPADTYGLGFEFRFAPRWSTELTWNRATPDRDSGDPGSSDFDSYRVDGLYYFADPADALNPYVSAGVGRAHFGGGPDIDTKGTDHDETRVNVGLGLRYSLTERVSVRGDLRGFHGIDESTYDGLASLGLSLAFGSGAAAEPVATTAPDSDNDGVADDYDRCLDTPAGIDVNDFGCERDSDNDGVVDSRDRCPDSPAGAIVGSRGCELDSDNDGVVDRTDACADTPTGAKVDNIGCKITIETVELAITFASESAEIQQDDHQEIRELANYLRDHPDASVKIAGHADGTGPASYNRGLSERRARAVADRLTDVLDIDKSRVTAVGYGESVPVATNETAVGRGLNRRVEAHIQFR